MTNSTTFMLNTSNGRHVLRLDEIVRLEATSNYTYIHLTNRRKMLSAKVLKDFTAMLQPFGFLRTHRTHLVNPFHIAFVPTGTNTIIMRDESVAEVSRRMRSGVMKALQHAA